MSWLIIIFFQGWNSYFSLSLSSVLLTVIFILIIPVGQISRPSLYFHPHLLFFFITLSILIHSVYLPTLIHCMCPISPIYFLFIIFPPFLTSKTQSCTFWAATGADGFNSFFHSLSLPSILAPLPSFVFSSFHPIPFKFFEEQSFPFLEKDEKHDDDRNLHVNIFRYSFCIKSCVTERKEEDFATFGYNSSESCLTWRRERSQKGGIIDGHEICDPKVIADTNCDPTLNDLTLLLGREGKGWTPSGIKIEERESNTWWSITANNK